MTGSTIFNDAIFLQLRSGSSALITVVGTVDVADGNWHHGERWGQALISD